ncbi:MAG: amidohydrolase family protein [Verrucomicrobia bacterium]|nr:amidohydrolase family protein [Verrucomicrobiota bacterium]
MNRFLIKSLLLVFFFPTLLFAQGDTTPVKGIHANTPRVHALTHATIVTAPSEMLEDATMVIRDGIIESVGANVEAPGDARIWDMTGKTVYAGFIDAYSQYGMPEGLKIFSPSRGATEGPPKKMPPTPSQSGASSWNPLVTPERDAADHFKSNKKATESLNDTGFTTVATFPARGIFRGQGLLVNTDGQSLNDSTVKTGLAQHIAFDHWSQSRTERPNDGDSYPSSTMGSIALVRQTLYDAKWYTDAAEAYDKNPDQLEKPEENAALEALKLLTNQNQWALFKADDELAYQRVEKVADEFGLEYAILGNGYEYRRADILKSLGKTVILPLSFPKTPHVERPDKSLNLSLEQLQHWELAPSNAAFLAKAGVSFCFTAHFNPDPGKSVWNAIRESVKRGLSEEDALAAITTNPALLYDVDAQLGTIVAGKIANLTVATGNLFTDEKARVSELWIQGNYVEKKPAKEIDLEGTWEFSWAGVGGFETGTIKGSGQKISLKTGKVTIPVSLQNSEILFSASPTLLGENEESGLARLQAYVSDDTLSGSGQLPNGDNFSWSAVKNAKENNEEEEEEKEKDNDKDKKEQEIPELVFDRYPAGVYGVGQREKSETVLIQNATIWTSGPDGVLEENDLLIQDGKIVSVGKNLKAPRNSIIVDAYGKHVTPGLIDCHSHIAGSGGINEGASAVSVEVRIGDIINPADINIYRQLAGGLTTSNILHGSANPMGGQSQVIKLRWGKDAEDLKFEGARPSVKFALGENVKRSRSPDSTRYPQSRMGVEQVFITNFRAAEDYERRWADFNAGRSLAPPRIDLRKAAALEILRRERVIHIHSYRQDEILMFARLAKKLNLEVAAFQHILEGYKVADALAEIGAGGSSFSDWWAYKFEVIDAIPYNGAIMHNAGVITSFNSDDAELATRLNTEAAKAVKYGGLSEEEALKFVTLNPAIQLRIDDRVGSLEKGKEADFVIWSDHPLSTYAHPEQTWIDGIKYFDKEESQAQFESDASERERLVQKALKQRIKEFKLETKKAPEKDPPGEPRPEESPDWIYHDGSNHYSCSAEEEGAHL